MVLASATAHLRLDEKTWQEWNADVQEARAARPLTWKRKALQAKINAAGLQKRGRQEVTHVVQANLRRRFACKRPAATAPLQSVLVLKRPAAKGVAKMKRTPFNLERLHA